MVIGIDNGARTGAAVALSSWDGALLGYTTLPTHVVGKKTELDTKAFRDWVCDLKVPPAIVGIEEPLHYAPSSQAVRSMAICFGQLMGLCCGMVWPCERVAVREWQKDMLGKFPKGQSKKAAAKAAYELEPNEQWLDPRKPRSTKAHDGIIDAFLIAKWLYLRRFA